MPYLFHLHESLQPGSQYCNVPRWSRIPSLPQSWGTVSSSSCPVCLARAEPQFFHLPLDMVGGVPAPKGLLFQPHQASPCGRCPLRKDGGLVGYFHHVTLSSGLLISFASSLTCFLLCIVRQYKSDPSIQFGSIVKVVCLQQKISVKYLH